MRAREFIIETTSEGDMHPHHATVQQGVQKSRDVGGYDRIYHMNRMWMATAMADGKSKKPVKMDSASWTEKYNTQHPYTQEEYNMFRQAEATIPTDSKEVSAWSKSSEPHDTHKVSPTSNWNPGLPKTKKVKESASAGATSSGSIATNPSASGKKPSQVGSLFGGTYGEDQNKPIIKKKSKLVRRPQ
jgi:hypothetical protein